MALTQGATGPAKKESSGIFSRRQNVNIRGSRGEKVVQRALHEARGAFCPWLDRISFPAFNTIRHVGFPVVGGNRNADVTIACPSNLASRRDLFASDVEHLVDNAKDF